MSKEEVNLISQFCELEDARYQVYDDEREDIITYISTYDMQGQSIKAN